MLNVSFPIGFSFNDNVSETGQEKVVMSSAKKFGQSVLKAGRGARMTKFDMRNAYKIVPCNIEEASNGEGDFLLSLPESSEIRQTLT